MVSLICHIYTNTKESHHNLSCLLDESYFPYRKQSLIDGHVKERLESQLQVDFPVTWEPHYKALPRKVHYDLVSDELKMKVVEKPETFVLVNQYQYETIEKPEGKSSGIDYNKLPKHFGDAMSPKMHQNGCH